MAKKQLTQGGMIDVVDFNDSGSSEKTQKMIIAAVAVVGILFALFYGYKTMFQQPKQIEAEEQVSKAIFQFERDSFSQALNDPGEGYLGFLDIIDDYSGTAVANTAKYYAGISYLNLGDFEKAIDYLNKFNAKGSVLPAMKFGALADAYAEQNEMDKAKSFYNKAISKTENIALVTYYMKKLAMLHEYEGNNEEALKLYQSIKDNYPQSATSKDIDKYIEKLK